MRRSFSKVNALCFRGLQQVLPASSRAIDVPRAALGLVSGNRRIGVKLVWPPTNHHRKNATLVRHGGRVSLLGFVMGDARPSRVATPSGTLFAEAEFMCFISRLNTIVPVVLWLGFAGCQSGMADQPTRADAAVSAQRPEDPSPPRPVVTGADAQPDAGGAPPNPEDAGAPGPGIGDAGSPVPDRIVFFYVPHGVELKKFLPVGTKTDFALQPMMASLSAYKSKLTILKGLELVKPLPDCSDFVVAEYNRGVTMSSTIELTAETDPLGVLRGHLCDSTGPTLDQVLGKTARIRGDTEYATVNLSVFAAVEKNYPREHVSYEGKGKPVPQIADPGTFISEVLQKTQSPQTRNAFLKLKAVRDGLPAKLSSVNYTAVSSLDGALVARIFEEDLSRVAVLNFGMYSGVPGFFSNLRQLSHETDDPFYRSEHARLLTWYVSEYAALLGKLEAIKQPDGLTLLDHTLVVWVTDTGEAIYHQRQNIVAMVAGNAGGRLVQGQFLDAKGRQNADLWLTLAQAMGSDITSFGDPGVSSGVFTEMLR
jgi:Protein of unknown function (DUF1552)